MRQYPFITALPSEAAIKLANAIYQTYMLDESSHIKISVKRLCEVFGRKHTPETISYFKSLFEELNEPVVITDFTYREHFYQWMILQFCSFEKFWHDKDAYCYIAINELYLAAMRELMDKPFIFFKD